MLKITRSLLSIIVFVTLIFPNAIGQIHVELAPQTSKVLAKASFSDFDVNRYHIDLDITDFSGKRIEGNTEVTFTAINNLDSVILYLEALSVDSVLGQGAKLNYSHSGIRLAIALKTQLKSAEKASIKIFYGGSPVRDPQWGGFYFSGVYAYNMGVGFASDPHNFGRVWFPCVDNFTDKALFDFDITCTIDKTAMCNGTLQGVVDNGNGTHTYSWKMADPISTYLASVAVAPYTLNEFQHKSIPVILTSVKEDSMDMALSFKNLPNCIDLYLEKYGPHRFERIGFNEVPFTSGAMEHATNIAYPINYIDGLATGETLYAHELAHHWWGNSVTCKTAGDMWINEGWASFSEFLFVETVYGRERYLEDMSDNHRKVLHYAHLRDEDTLAIAGVPHNATYGSHVYDKGADVIHTLRGYMGDAAFFNATQTFMESYKYQNVTSADVETHFQKHTSRDLSKFFKHWVYQPGFPAFDVLEWNVVKSDVNYESKVRIRQRLRFAPEFFTGVPLELTAIGPKFERYKIEVTISSGDEWFTTQTPFEPLTWFIDIDQKISDAVTDHMEVIGDTGTYDFKNALMSLHVNRSQDSSLVRVEHYWVAPDAWFNEGNQPFLSRERYWNVDGVFSETFEASATIAYNGRNAGLNFPDGFFDNDLIRIREDSLVLMYRETPSSPWRVDEFHTFDIRSPFDKRGTITIDRLRRGEYALAIRDASLLSVPHVETTTTEYLKIYPNPTEGELTLEVSGAAKAWLEITSSNGSLIHRERVKSKNYTTKIDTSAWARGIYYAGLVIEGVPYAPKLFFVR